MVQYMFLFSMLCEGMFMIYLVVEVYLMYIYVLGGYVEVQLGWVIVLVDFVLCSDNLDVVWVQIVCDVVVLLMVVVFIDMVYVWLYV